MKSIIDPSTGQPYVDPITGQPIDTSTKAGRQALKRAKKAGKKAKRGARRFRRGQKQLPAGVQAAQTMASYPPYPGAAIQPYNPSCSGACFPNVGWLGPYLTMMGAARRWVMSMDPENQVIVDQGQPLILAPDSPASLVNAAMLAVQGDGTKGIIEAAWPAVPADTTIAVGAGTKVFGVLVRISNSVLNFKFGTYKFSLLDVAVVRATVWVRVRKLPMEVIILNISNVSGMGSVIPNTDARVRFLLADNPTLVSGDILYAESLNMRDIGDPVSNAGGVMNLR